MRGAIKNRSFLRTPTNNKYLVYGLCFVVGAFVGAAAFHFLPSPTRKPAREPAASAKSQASEKLPPRPWGQLDTLAFPFADSEALAPDRDLRLRKTQWYFEGISQVELERFLNSCGLAENQKQQLTRGSQWQVASNGFVVSPSDDLVQSLGPATRSTIYEYLSHSEVNYAQRFPFRFPFGAFPTRFAFTGLAQDKINLIQGLTYTNTDHEDLCFADLQLLPKLLSAADVEKAIDALYRVPSYRLRLRVFEDSNVDQLVAYWGKGGREGRIRPLLDSMKKVAGADGKSVNISYLFPEFARLRLYTFPTNWPDKHLTQEDCFWSSMNFFNPEPDDRFLSADAAVQSLVTDCIPVPAEHDKQFGDLIAITDGQGKGIHMCVHIAEDFVFTKNGRNMLSPWVIMKMSDMLALFPADHRRVLTYRRKELGPQKENKLAKKNL
jgi:hypothetical protein